MGTYVGRKVMARTDRLDSRDRISPPESWREPTTHWAVVLQHPWYRELVRVQHELLRAVHGFFTDRGLISPPLPVTTGSISSPTCAGSDSLPVEVELFGERTFLADSMQFMLELACRLHPKGAYYVMPSFRGEMTDARHLPQFFHAEAEIPGTFPDMIELASAFVHSITSTLIDRCPDAIGRLAGGLDHVEELMSHGGRYPALQFGEAVADLAGTGTSRDTSGVVTIDPAGEATLARRHGAGGLALWLTHFDRRSVPFYQAWRLIHCD